MQNLFEPSERDAIIRRLAALPPDSPRQWGTMSVAQMLAHCAVALEVPCRDTVKKQALIGRVLAPFVRSSVLGDKPFRRNAPTDPDFKIAGDRDFNVEKQRLETLIGRFCSAGPSAADGVVHSFFGRLSAEQWGRLMYKHLDHHLQQFGA